MYLGISRSTERSAMGKFDYDDGVSLRVRYYTSTNPTVSNQEKCIFYFFNFGFKDLKERLISCLDAPPIQTKDTRKASVFCKAFSGMRASWTLIPKPPASGL